MSIAQEIAAHGGLAPTYRLLRRGWTSYTLTRAVRSGSIIRVRQGWYALPDEQENRLASVAGTITDPPASSSGTVRGNTDDHRPPLPIQWCSIGI